MPKSIVTRARARLVIACLVVAGALFALAACGGSSSDKSSTASGGGSSGSVDDGSKITMWTRAATSAYSQLLVDAYNKTHKNQVKLTVIPTDSYQPKIAAAAGGAFAARRARGRRRLRAQLREQGAARRPHRAA